MLAKFGFDTAENELCKVCPLSAYRSPRSILYNGDVRLVSAGEDSTARVFKL